MKHNGNFTVLSWPIKHFRKKCVYIIVLATVDNNISSYIVGLNNCIIGTANTAYFQTHTTFGQA